MVLFLVLLIASSGKSFASPGDCVQTTDEIESADDTLLETHWSGTCVVEGWKTIDTDETLTIAPGSRVLFADGGSLQIRGRLNARGTVDAPIVFDRAAGNTQSYQVELDGEMTLRNTQVLRGGIMYSASLMERNPLPFVATAYAETFRSGAITVRNGARLDAEAVTFRENVIAITADRQARVKVWRSSFIHTTGRAFFGTRLDEAADLRYDWWDRPEGARVICGNFCPPDAFDQEGDVEGWADTSDQAETGDFRDPVIVVPGILGSWRWTTRGNFLMDPMLHKYDNLLEMLEINGYVPDKTLFTLPYNWRESNADTARLLMDQIARVKAEQHWPRVDIVAHSMGGLVARDYIESMDYRDDVDQLITLGTPHAGSPVGYLLWEAGEFGSFSPTDILIKKVLQQEAEEKGYENLFQYIRQAPIVSVRELLPVSDYLIASESGIDRHYPELSPRNPLLEQLVEPTNLEKLRQVEVDVIAGKRKDASTIQSLRVGSPSVALMNTDQLTLWEYGKPEGYDGFFGDRGMNLGPGDGTVPLASATAISADQTIELDAEHSEMTSRAKDDVIRLLLDKTPIQKPIWNADSQSLLAFFVHSPVDISVTTADGVDIGRDFAHDRDYTSPEGAFYTGSDTDTEFVTIRTPVVGTYVVHARGTGEGDFRIEAVAIQGHSDGPATESTVDLRGTATRGDGRTFAVTLTRDMQVQTLDVSPAPPSTDGHRGLDDDVPVDVASVAADANELVVIPSQQHPTKTDSVSSQHREKQDERVSGPQARNAGINLATADLSLGNTTIDGASTAVDAPIGMNDGFAPDGPGKTTSTDTSSPWVWIGLVIIVVTTPFGLLWAARIKGK